MITFLITTGNVCLEDFILIICVISGAQSYYLSSTVCRCEWELTSIGCLMTVLFVWWVPPQKKQGRLLYQEIAVEED